MWIVWGVHSVDEDRKERAAHAARPRTYQGRQRRGFARRGRAGASGAAAARPRLAFCDVP